MINLEHNFDELVNYNSNMHYGKLYEKAIDQIEKPLIESVLKNQRYNQTETARILGISRGTLRVKLKKHGLL